MIDITAGPWHCGTYMRKISIAAHQRIYMRGPCAAGVWSMGCDNAAVERVARLIAAAPKLLAALKWAVSQIEDDLGPDHQAALAAAYAAINKGEGKA